MSSNKNYILKKGDVLTGSSLLRKKNSNSDRVKYMLDNIRYNKAYIHKLFSNNCSNKEELETQFKKEFIKYRYNWDNLPSYLVKNKYSNAKMKKEEITPLCLDIETASICDLACPFCFREYTVTPDKIIDEDVCYDLIDQAAEMNIPSIKFNWRGEPLLHPKLTNFISYAKEKGILETIINTNATNLSEEYSERLIESGLDFMIYSFDGGTKETYEKMRPGRFKENSFDKVYSNIKNFSLIKKRKKSKFPYTKIQMILTEDTHNEKDEFFSLFNDYVDDVSLSQYTERGGKLTDLDENSQSLYYHLLLKHNMPRGTPYMKDAFGNIKLSYGRVPCEQPFQRLLITYEGRVAMCCYDWGATYPVGYTNEKALENIKDYTDVIEKVKNDKKGFALLKSVKMPKQFNNPPKKRSSINDIWYGKEIELVRQKHINNKGEEVNICKNCSFKDVYKWHE